MTVGTRWDAVTRYHRDELGCRDTDHITCWFLQGHNINNNNPSDYNIMDIY